MSGGPSADRPQREFDRTQLLTLAHELRGALTIIAGYNELLGRHLDEPARDTALQGIARAVSRADRLLEDALLGEEGGRLKIVPLDLAELAEKVADEQRAATGRAIDVVIAERPWVAGDADALSRLLGNLIDNAVKYSPTTEPVEVKVTATVETAAFAVSDRGPGIAEEDRGRAFERFERLEAPSGIAGSGVGLAVVGELVHAHGGTVRIDDRAGGGTAVTVGLPRLAK